MKGLITTLIFLANLTFPQTAPSQEVIPEELTPPIVSTIDISIAGDCMLASYKNQTTAGNFNDLANKYTADYFLSEVQSVFANDDFTLVNLENVLTDNNLEEVTKNHSPAYWFRSRTKNTEILTQGSVEAVSLANNHYGDYGIQGKKDTRDALEAAGLKYGDNDKTIYFEKDGYKVAVICYGLWVESQADFIVKKIKAASEVSDFQIVFYHGGKEGIHTPEEWKVRASKKLVDAGADLVIGNHPHVLQPRETYNGVDIVYSVGNFCYGGSIKPENRTIIYKLRLTLYDGVLVDKEAEIVPCYVYTGNINNYQPDIIEDQVDKQKVLDFMNSERELPY